MAQWFSSDLHLGHRNIIRYCARPFADVDEMNEALVDRWNDLVAPDDDVWVLGDVAMGKISETLPLVGLLNGRKVLVAGNHDRCWAGHGDDHLDWVQRYLDAGFAEIRQGAVKVDLVGSGASRRAHRTVLACHFPYEGDSQDEDRYPGARPKDRGEWLLHGHVHEVWRQHGRMINVGIDAWGGVPVSADDLLALIDAGVDNHEPLSWTNDPGMRSVGV